MVTKERLYWRHPVYCLECKEENKLYLHKSIIRKDVIDNIDDLIPRYEKNNDSVIWKSEWKSGTDEFEEYYCDMKYHQVLFRCENKHCSSYDYNQRFELSNNYFKAYDHFGFLIGAVLNPIPYRDVESVKICIGKGAINIVYFYRNGKEEIHYHLQEAYPFDIDTNEIYYTDN